MILSDLVIPSRVNAQWQYSGMDSLEQCLNKDHFQSYPHPIDYAYNSRGFRDAEWPESVEELKNAIWCVGDSFTVGLGSPYKFTWPQVLSAATGRRCVNVSMDGASNDWISRRAHQIIREVEPAHMVVMWSYTHRIEHPNVDLPDEDRRLYSSKDSHYQDYVHWTTIQEQMQHQHVEIIQATVPGFTEIYHDSILDHWNSVKDPSWPSCPASLEDLENLPDYIKNELVLVHGCYHRFEFWLNNQSNNTYCVSRDIEVDPCVFPNNVIYLWQQLDWARDYHHFDLLTSQWLVDQICQQLDPQTRSRN